MGRYVDLVGKVFSHLTVMEKVGTKHTIAEWSRLTGIPPSTIRRRHLKDMPSYLVLSYEG